MNTLKQLLSGLNQIPTATTWYLTDLAEFKGRQQLFIHQSPQQLEALREHALIESAVSSNRIEGVEIEQKRIATVVFGKSILLDRMEEEIRGYRQGLNLIHQRKSELQINEATTLKLHRLVRGEIADAGQYKQKDTDIIEKSADGSQRIRFKTVPARQTPLFMTGLTQSWHELLTTPLIPPLVAAAAFNLDFLCIHPFRDGNGRVSRLLLLLQTYHLGFEVGRYISLERLIEQNKERYYETLELASQQWHQGSHNPWPYIQFLLFILKTACEEFENRLKQSSPSRGAKTAIIQNIIEQTEGPFTLHELESKCPTISREMIRTVLRQLRQQGKVVCTGRGPAASWRKTT